MKNVLLIDFGSTYTKLTAVDVDSEKILATASAYTTVDTDINDGLNAGLKILEEKTEIAGLVRVRISVSDGTKDLFAIPAAWQEVIVRE